MVNNREGIFEVFGTNGILEKYPIARKFRRNFPDKGSFKYDVQNLDGRFCDYPKIFLAYYPKGKDAIVHMISVCPSAVWRLILHAFILHYVPYFFGRCVQLDLKTGNREK